MSRRVIAVFTGSRAEYGLQHPVLSAIDAHDALDYRLIASGSHLDDAFGRTAQEIVKDGFTIHEQIRIDIRADDLAATARAIGFGVTGVCDALERTRPDMLVVYGDRFEGFAAVIAGTQMGLPTAHIEGGDITDGGALDDTVRHAMTKLSHLHFTTNEQASNRVLGLGEEPWRVHNVGLPALDRIVRGSYAKRAEVLQRFRLDPDRPIIVFTQHAVTTESDQAVDQVRPSLDALKRLGREGVQVVMTYPNNDAGGRRIIAELESVRDGDAGNLQVHHSLGSHNYHGLLALAREPGLRVACVGNSSSGIKETPAFGCPTVNIGSRQHRRLRASNVLDCGYDVTEIYETVHRCLFDEEFRASCRQCGNPYGVGDAGEKIANVLASVALDHRLIRKSMCLRGEARDGWYR